MNTVKKLMIVAVAAAVPAAASAQDKMPTAKEVMARYVKVTGGKEAYAKIKSYTMKSEMTMAAVGMKASINVFGTLKPAQMYQGIDLGQFGGMMERFITKKAVWETSAVQGTRVLTGVERAQNLKEASFAPELTPEKFYKAMKVAGKEKVEGEECYKVVLTPKTGKPETVYYSVKTGLKTKIVQTAKTPQGDMQVESLSSDYKKVGGIMVAMKAVQKLPNGMTMQVKTQKVEFNKEIDKSKFKVPADIMEQVEAEKDETAASDK